MKVTFYYASLAMMTAACSNSNTNSASVAQSAAATMSFNSASLYKTITSVPSAQSAAAFSMLKALPVGAYYSLEERLAASSHASIDGLPVVDHISTAAQQARIKDLDAQFSSMGDLWNNSGITSPAISQVDFVQGLHSMLGGTSGLALDDEGTKVVVKKTCDDQTKTALGAELAKAVNGNKADAATMTSIIATMKKTAQEAINDYESGGSYHNNLTAGHFDAYAWSGDLDPNDYLSTLTIVPYGPSSSDDGSPAAQASADKAAKDITSQCLTTNP